MNENQLYKNTYQIKYKINQIIIQERQIMQKITSSFEQKELEISQAISALRHHGINIELPEKMAKQLEATTLFDGDDALFKELITNAELYFEYGCGKSTEFVYKYCSASIFSVDTSSDWVNKINRLRNEGENSRLNIDWIDVGEVADWGYPISFDMRYNFVKYAESLWSYKKNPDLVLIDGRFRVLCFLNSIKFAEVGTKILFDDYTNRPFYHVAEEFCRKIDVCGRQALFEVSALSKNKINDSIISSFKNVIG